MRRAIWFSEAVRAAILIIGFTAILTIWPLRLWQRTIPEKGGGVRMEVSDQIDDDSDLVQTFIAQYDRLGSVDVYVDEVMSGRCLWLIVFDEQTQICFRKFVDLEGETIPGVVNIPLGLSLEVGKPYRLVFLGVHSAYRLGLQNIPEFHIDLLR